jgi:mannitol/fructose-specific phosphotransferase system IIA component (Ntr-type)
MGFIGFSVLWYYIYSRRRNLKQSALLQIVERITSKEIKSSVLTDELRDILFERDGIVEDKFDSIVKKATFMDIREEINDDGLFEKIAENFSKKFNISSQSIFNLFCEEEEKFDSVIYEGLAILNIVIQGESKFDIIILRSQHGISLGKGTPKAHIIFALAGSKDERSFYLKTLVAIAQIVQNKEFINNWKKAHSIHDLKNLILLSERIRSRRI